MGRLRLARRPGLPLYVFNFYAAIPSTDQDVVRQ